MIVYFKTGYENAWSQRSTKVVSDMIQDPFWPTKQSSDASNDAILFDCGVGFIRRSIDGGQNWIVVTPSTNPPNDAADSPIPTVSSLDFIQGDANWTYTDEFVFLARWKNIDDDWRSWLVYTDDNGGSWSWQSIGAEATIPGSVTTTTTTSYFVTFANELASVQMSSTRILSVLNDDGGGQAVLISVDTGAGTVTELDTLSLTVGGSDNRIVRLTDEKALICYLSGGASLRATILTITGDTIVQGSELTIVNAVAIGLANGSSSTRAWVAYNESGGNVNVQELSISNTTISISGSPIQLTTDNVLDLSIHAITPSGTFDGLLVTYRNATVSNRPYAQRISFSPTTVGAQAQLDANAMSIISHIQDGVRRLAPVATNSAFFAYVWITASSNTLNMICIDASSTILSTGAILAGSANSESPSIDTHGTNVCLVAYNYDTDTECRAFTLSVDTSTLALTDNGDDFLVYNTANTGNNTSTISLSTSKAIIAQTVVSDLHHHLISISPGGVSATRVLGLSIGKGLGATVYITTHDAGLNELLLSLYSLPGLTEDTVLSLGAASSAEVDNLTRFAYPFAGIGDDDWVIIYGLMNDPYTLGDPVYVLESDDGGATASLVPVDSTWASGGCGALWMESDGMMYAIRNLGSSSKLYYGNAVVELNLMSTLPFPAGVSPHGIKVDSNDLSVYAAADAAQSIMVAKSFPLYAKWIDMTYDHGVAGKINSLELL